MRSESVTFILQVYTHRPLVSHDNRAFTLARLGGAWPRHASSPASHRTAARDIPSYPTQRCHMLRGPSISSDFTCLPSTLNPLTVDLRPEAQRIRSLTFQNPLPRPRPLPPPPPPPLPLPPPLMGGPAPLAPLLSVSFLALFFGLGVSSISSVSNGKLSGKMKYRISLPRTLIWSRLICEPPFGVIFAARRFVFICGETEAMVPWMMAPVLSSMVTVSLVHFMRNLGCIFRQSGSGGCSLGRGFVQHAVGLRG